MAYKKLYIPPNKLRRLWVTVKSLGWTKDQFYDWLHENFSLTNRKVYRLHDLYLTEIDEVIEHLSRMSGKNGRLSQAQENLIYLWAGKLVRNPDKKDAYIKAVIKNVAKVDDVRFLTPKLAIKVIEAMKAAYKRKAHV